MSTRLLKDKINGFHVTKFNLLRSTTQLIIHIQIWLSFLVKYIICGREIESWKYRSGKMAQSKIKQ